MFIQGKILSYGDDLSEVFSIRNQVFVEELGISKDNEFDELDSISMHVIVYEGADQNRAVATGRIEYDGDICRISKIAVLKDYRGKEYGDFVVRMLLNKAFTSGISEVYVNSLLITKGFFETIGFEEVEDEMKIGIINHINMIIKADKLCSGCQK